MSGTERARFAPALLQRIRPRKIVLFRASRIGDFICATPAFRALRAAVPGAEITLVALPLVSGLAARCRSIDRFEPFPGMPGIAEQFFDAARALDFFQRMQAERFDLGIQMHGSGVYANPITLMFGARTTAGFVRDGDPVGRLDLAVRMPAAIPEVARLLALADVLGAPACGEQTEFPLWREDARAADGVLRELPRPIVAVHAGAREATKRWAPERFAAAANALVRRRGGSIVIIGGPDELPISARVAAGLDVPFLDLTGRVALPVLGAILSRVGVLLTNDSGPAHIAYALRTPVVTLFGGTDPDRWRPLVPGPFRLLAHPASCRPCDHASCPMDRFCLDALTVDAVMAAASEVIRA